jgi:aldehyde dehydrogenase (NAD+)
MIIDESCDLNYTAKKSAAMAFLNSGQLCIRSDYVLVHNSISERFLTKLKENIDALYQNGSRKATLGKCINKFHHDRCC